MQLWNNNQSNGEDGNAKEQSKIFLNEEEFKKALKQIKMKYNKLLKKLKDGNNE
jgi:ABC-type glycerol-3-phosphate transport system substrate-binding protein